MRSGYLLYFEVGADGGVLGEVSALCDPGLYK
jgi:hypothetical protein